MIFEFRLASSFDLSILSFYTDVGATMNAVLRSPAEPPGRDSVAGPSGAETRYVWEGRFGTVVIEVRDGRVYVDGALVEPLDRRPVQMGRNFASKGDTAEGASPAT